MSSNERIKKGRRLKAGVTQASAPPEGYFKAVFKRFLKKPTGIAAIIILAVILLFAFLTVALNPQPIPPDSIYSNKRPKSRLGLFGMDGTVVRRVSKSNFILLSGLAEGSQYGISELSQRTASRDVPSSGGEAQGEGAQQGEKASQREDLSPIKQIISTEGDITVRVDVYLQEGFRLLSVTEDEMDRIRAWESQSGVAVLYPMIDTESHHPKVKNASIWYKVDKALMPLEGRLIPNYLTNKDGSYIYATPSDSNMWRIRVLYYNYYRYKNGREPYYELGTDSSGHDILTRLARSVLFSLAIALGVSAINLTVGTLYGAVEGYYGGRVDLVLERVSEILGGLPLIVTVTLVGQRVTSGAVWQLLIAFLLTGWLGTASRVRAQFYRFKGRQYVLAARTLGASSGYIMLHHILPNALGTVITSSVLVVPGVIFSESMLSYLGIISLQGDTPGLGAMLASAQGVFTKYPYQMLFPAAVISLIMIAFNLFGDALRDAFEEE